MTASPLETQVAALAREATFSGVILVARGDAVLAGRAWKTPMRTGAVFPFCSITKTFTALLQKLAASR